VVDFFSPVFDRYTPLLRYLLNISCIYGYIYKTSAEYVHIYIFFFYHVIRVMFVLRVNCRIVDTVYGFRLIIS
jgi:hypothetical protein